MNVYLYTWAFIKYALAFIISEFTHRFWKNMKEHLIVAILLLHKFSRNTLANRPNSDTILPSYFLFGYDNYGIQEEQFTNTDNYITQVKDKTMFV